MSAPVAAAALATPERVLLSDYDYELPAERIAQQPATPRDSARLLVLDRDTGALAHHAFRDLAGLLRPDDLLVVNETRVSALRLLGTRSAGAPVEALLLRPDLSPGAAPNTFDALVRPGRKVRPGDRLRFENAGLVANVVGITESGGRLLHFETESGASDEATIAERLETAGRVPLPPYISAPLADPGRYQTVYARTPGSAAAPTAGLHFSPELLARLQGNGVETATVRLDVGLGTFRPIRTENLDEHVMHAEAFDVPPSTAARVNACPGRVIAVGTTTLRALETAAGTVPAGDKRRVAPTSGETQLFVRPGYRFRAVDALVTNFHQPHSTLLLLVGAFAGRTVEQGRTNLRRAYQAALDNDYRFLSFGDAMFITGSGGPK